MANKMYDWDCDQTFGLPRRIRNLETGKIRNFHSGDIIESWKKDVNFCYSNNFEYNLKVDDSISDYLNKIKYRINYTTGQYEPSRFFKFLQSLFN